MFSLLSGRGVNRGLSRTFAQAPDIPAKKDELVRILALIFFFHDTCGVTWSKLGLHVTVNRTGFDSSHRRHGIDSDEYEMFRRLTVSARRCFGRLIRLARFPSMMKMRPRWWRDHALIFDLSREV